MDTPHNLTIGDARIELVQESSGTHPAWLLIPGGPGIGSAYLRELFHSIGVKGDVWTFDLIDPTNTPPADGVVVEGWKSSLRQALERIGPAIVMGHSFGGMLALSTKGIETLSTALVLVDTAPDRGWEQKAQDAACKLDVSEAVALEAEFELTPTSELYKRLCIAWSPYYFSPKHAAEGRALLARNTYQPMVYRIGSRQFLPNYAMRAETTTLPTFCIAGENDLITPLSLFKERAAGHADMEYFPIAGGGHFPWVENFQGFAAAVRQIESNVSRRMKCAK